VEPRRLPYPLRFARGPSAGTKSSGAPKDATRKPARLGGIEAKIRVKAHPGRNLIYPPFVITNKENQMKKTLTLFPLMIVLILNSCTTLVPVPSTPLPSTEATTSIETQVLTPVSPTEVNPSALQKPYTNNIFGLSFQYPSNWFGPSEYVGRNPAGRSWI
jgi:hypothetical protein